MVKLAGQLEPRCFGDEGNVRLCDVTNRLDVVQKPCWNDHGASERFGWKTAAVGRWCVSKSARYCTESHEIVTSSIIFSVIYLAFEGVGILFVYLS